MEAMHGVHMGRKHIKSQASPENPQVPMEDEFSTTNLLEVVGAVEMEQNEMSGLVTAWQPLAPLALIAGVHESIKCVLLGDIVCGLATLQHALDRV